MRIKSIIEGLLGAKGTYKRDSLIMSSGAAVNVLIAFVLTTRVTRIFDKEEFGVFYLFNSMVLVSSLVVSGMYPHAFVVPKDENSFLKLLKLSLILTGIGALVVALFLLVGGDYFLSLIHGERLEGYLWLVPIGVLISSVNIILTNWNVRRKEFSRNATSNVALSLTSKSSQLLYGYTIGGFFQGLIWSDIISKVVSSIILTSKSMVRELGQLGSISFKELKETAGKFNKYPKYILPGNFINRFSDDIPLYLLSAYFGTATVGAFGFASMMLGIPYNVIGRSIAPVFFQKANELYHDDIEKLRTFAKEAYSKMLVYGSLAFGFVFAFGDVAFAYVFSAEWKQAGQIAGILSVFYVFRIISSPFSAIFRVVGKEEKSLIISIVLAVLRTVGIYIGVLTGDILYAVTIFTSANVIGYLMNNIQIISLLGINKTKVLIRTVVISVGIFAGFVLMRNLIELVYEF